MQEPRVLWGEKRRLGRCFGTSCLSRFFLFLLALPWLFALLWLLALAFWTCHLLEIICVLDDSSETRRERAVSGEGRAPSELRGSCGLATSCRCCTLWPCLLGRCSTSCSARRGWPHGEKLTLPLGTPLQQNCCRRSIASLPVSSSRAVSKFERARFFAPLSLSS